jgi:hypothetical protein
VNGALVGLRGFVAATTVHQMPDLDRAPRNGHRPLDVTDDAP